MVSLDMSDALLDALLLDSFDVIRRLQSVDSSGRTVTNLSTKSGVLGVVTAASPVDLQRLVDYQVQGKTVSIVTQYRLHGIVKNGTDEYQPDIVVWNNSQFLVILVDDYSRYGAGWMQVIATSKENSDQTPVDVVTPSMVFTDKLNSELVTCL